MAVVDLILSLVKAVVFVYDVVTYPIYNLFQQPWENRTRQKLGPVNAIENHSKGVSFHRNKGNSLIYEEIIVRNKVNTVTKAFNYAVKKFGSKECLGTREVLGTEDEVQSNGKVFQKLALGDYKWTSYDQVHALVTAFGRGLRLLGLNSGDRISMYGETRCEWIVSCLGAFSQNIHVSTVYTNLGEDAVIHALKETEARVVVTSHELLPQFEKIIAQVPTIEYVIFMEDQLVTSKTEHLPTRVKYLPFQHVVKQGVDSTLDESKVTQPTPDDIAIIMYTSGSTGTPKGVVLTHRNLVSTMECLMFMLDPKDDIYIAFLPLAHVLELLSENTMMLFGIKVGYSSPTTMTDMSTKVRKGYKGDASVLKPTMMCAVPLIMDRIYKNILDSVKKRGPAFKKFFDYCFQYKHYWMKRGKGTPICDRIVFNKIRKLLGGRMEFILVGGAPLNPETHNFIRTCLGVILVQGYSLTESCCSGTVMENSSMSTGTVGQPMTGLEVKLIDWEEGNYKVADKPNARGEICLKGPTIAKGYFKLPEKTDESFLNINGQRWFKTGDIGEFDKNGVLKIIDRKKDLVKLQQGEYVSLGKVEAQFKTHPLVDNICVYGDPLKTNTVALVVPSRLHLESLANSLGNHTESFEQLCDNPEVISAVQKELAENGKSAGLAGFEIPSTLTLCLEQWTPESGLITAAFKLKRKVLEAFYEQHINKMYKQPV